MFARRAGTLLLAVILALLCLGCSDDVRLLTAWTRVAPDSALSPVTLPGELRPDATTVSTHTVLETEVLVPPAWAGKPLTLAISQLEGDAALYADGRALSDRRLGFAHQWRIAEAARASPAIRLRLELDPALWPWLRTAPRLSATAEGDDWYRFVRQSAFHTSYIVTSIVAFLLLLYVVLFLLDPRRSSHGWFAVQAAAGLPITSRVVLDTPRFLGGVRDAELQIACGSLGLIAAAFFVSAYFRTRPPPRPLLFLPAVCVPFSFFHPLSSVALYAHVALAALFGAIVWMTWTLVRLRATVADRSSATTIAVGWGFFIVVAGPDFLTSAPFGDFAQGFRGGVLGMGSFSALQATLLVRDYIRSLRAADMRAAELEAQSREVTLLNLELRRQIADRSRQLAEALGRIGGVVPPSVLFQPGDVVHGRYRVVRAIGQGGMGAVYEVARIADERRFALKILTGARTGGALARLAREAQIAAQLSHERLVSIADVDVSEAGTLYIVMELVAGATLVDLHDRYGDAAWALPVLCQIAAGLAVLHGEGIVHRDLKPSNVLVARPDDPDDPGVKIADFGIARVEDEGPELDETAIDPNADTAAPSKLSGGRGALTGTGILLGTPIYMAPELAHGARDARPSSDIWAFGVLAFELLSGAQPFALPPVIDAIARRPWSPAPALDETRCGASVPALVARCLRAEPESRPTADECVASLRASLAGARRSPKASTRS